jgi:hypothetical protein
MIVESTIATEVHGRFLVRPQQSSSVLIGFHGYGESAEDQLPRLAAIPGSDDWILVSILRAPHRKSCRQLDDASGS